MRKDLFERSGGVTLSDGPASRAKLQPSLNFRTVEEGLKAAYRDVHIRYRKDDDLEVTTENHRRLSAILEKFCLSFRRPIRVLDAGCGTGRYFHCLKNVTGLVGIDLSPEMLQAAQTPVRQEAVSAEAIQLVCGNVHLLSFPAQAFDFIYSLGMFGNGCPVTVELCNKFHEWLAEGGKLFFNAVDMATVPLVTRMRHQLRSLLAAWLPGRWRIALKGRSGSLPFFGLTKRRLEAILRASRFNEFTVSRHICQSPLWHGIHVECAASKTCA